MCTTSALGVPFEKCRDRAVSTLSGGEQKKLVLEALLRARDDMEKADVTALMESARRKVKQEAMPDIPESGPTIMSAVSQTQTGGLLSTALHHWTNAGGGEGIAWSA